MNIDLLEPGAPPGMNVLVIAYYFPPMGLSGVQRTMKFVKYLPEFGWRPIVLTAGEMPYYAHDESLMEELDPLINIDYLRIVRTEASGAPASKFAQKQGAALKLPSARYQRLRSKLLQTIYQPDSRIKWKNPALEAAEQIFAEERIDAIYATAPPYTDFLIARELSKRHNVPFLMDYRDVWVSNSALNFYATPFHKAYARKLENQCLRGSGAITVISRTMKEELLQHYPFLRHEDVIILPHGYDPEDLIAGSAMVDRFRKPEKFRMTYGGAFYVGYPGRSPVPMLEAVKLAIKKEPQLENDLELVFAGVLHKDYAKAIGKMGLDHIVTAMGYMPHREEVALLLASDVLWMIASDPFSTPGKLYEYLGTHKPIFGLVTPGSQTEKLLNDYGAGITAPPKDVPAIADILLDLYHRWRKTLLPKNINIPFVESFNRHSLTKEMARQLGLMLRP
jgi:glycosyltransferase involved in cell wall biosynthesis